MKTKAQGSNGLWKVACGGLAVIVICMALPLSQRWAAVPPAGEAGSLPRENAGQDAPSLAVPVAEHPMSGSHPFSEPAHESVAEVIGSDPNSRPSVEALRARLASARSAAEKGTAASALIKSGADAALQAWGEAVIAETDPSTIRAMMSALDNLNGEIGLQIITQLVELSDRPEVFDGLARTLSRMATTDTPQYLAELHKGPDVPVGQQERTLRLLGAIANPEAVPGLAGLLYQPDFGADVTKKASVSLGKIGNPASVIALAAAFNALPPEHFAQRQQTLEALASVSNPESATLLTDLAANSPQPLVATAAQEALRRFPPAKGTVTDESQTWLPAPEYLAGKPATQER